MSEFRFKNLSLPLNKKTYVMGILNITPDSFSDGGNYFSPDAALKKATQMVQDGVDILDVGAQSTRPDHNPVSPEEEWHRLQDVLPQILNLGLPVSVDTFYPEVAEKALKLGCHIINDVSGLVAPEMAEVVKKYHAGWIIMHAGDNIENTTADIAEKVHEWFLTALDKAKQYGIEKQSICLDPGIGFGKTMPQNLMLLAQTKTAKVEGVAYLIAASRKRVIAFADGKETNPDHRDSGTVAAHTAAVLQGADIVRVHDTFGGCQAARVADQIKNYKE